MNANSQPQSTPRALLHRINDVVRLTNVGRTTIYGEIAQGHLRIIKIGRATLVRDEDLHAWLDAIASGARHAA